MEKQTQIPNTKRCFMCEKLIKYEVKSEFSGALMLDGYQCPKGVMVNPYNFACDEIELNDKYNTQ